MENTFEVAPNDFVSFKCNLSDLNENSFNFDNLNFINFKWNTFYRVNCGNGIWSWMGFSSSFWHLKYLFNCVYEFAFKVEWKLFIFRMQSIWIRLFVIKFEVKLIWTQMILQLNQINWITFN